MKIQGWMANTFDDEKQKTIDYLESQDCENIVTKRDDFNEFTWDQYCDCDEDILRCLAVMLYYNDREPDQIELFKNDVRALLEKYPPRHVK